MPVANRSPSEKRCPVLAASNRQRLLAMALVLQILDDRLRLPLRLELSGREPPADDAVLESQVEIPVVHRDVVPALGTEGDSPLQFPVAVEVGKGGNAAAQEAA